MARRTNVLWASWLSILAACGDAGGGHGSGSETSGTVVTTTGSSTSASSTGDASGGGTGTGTSDPGTADGTSSDGGTDVGSGSETDGGGTTSPACSPGAAGPSIEAFEPAAPFAAESGMTYSGLQITNPDGPCITVSDVSNVVIVDSDIGPCGGEAAIVVTGSATDVVIEHNLIHDSPRGVLASPSGVVTTRDNRLFDITGVFPQGTAVEYDYMDAGGSIEHNCIEGSFGSDVVSGFQSSNLAIVGNEIHATITEPSAAGFTIGDSVDGLPGHDNYVADNVVSQTGGVPPGVFGSTGNTLLEGNCLPTGIQAYAYNGPFEGVTIQYNLIGPGWFAPDTDVIAGWDTNTFTDGGACPE